MIQLKRKQAAPTPSVLLNQGKTATDLLKAEYAAGKRDFKSDDFDSGIYGSPLVKEELIRLQDGKCAFCESLVRHISHGDVEHFRPKTGWVQTSERLNKPGYYWLAYDWSNLVLSCQICNQRHKKNYFPLIVPSRRALSHTDDLTNESPVFVNPVSENPESYVSFKEEIPVGLDGDNGRGQTTITQLGLDRKTLNEFRRTILNPIRDLYELANGVPETTPELKQRAWSKVKKYYDESSSETCHYSSMLKAFFRDNPLPATV